MIEFQHCWNSFMFNCNTSFPLYVMYSFPSKRSLKYVNKNRNKRDTSIKCCCWMINPEHICPSLTLISTYLNVLFHLFKENTYSVEWWICLIRFWGFNLKPWKIKLRTCQIENKLYLRWIKLYPSFNFIRVESDTSFEFDEDHNVCNGKQ